MAKRVPTSMAERLLLWQKENFNRENRDQGEEQEETGPYSSASNKKRRTRVIKRAKRTLRTTDHGEKKNPFSGFEGFKMNNKVSWSNFESNTSVNKSTNKSSNEDFGDPAKGICLLSLEASGGNEPSNNSEYYRYMQSLNESFLRWIQEHFKKNPCCNFTPVCRDYKNHASKVDTMFPREKIPDCPSTKPSTSADRIAKFSIFGDKSAKIKKLKGVKKDNRIQDNGEKSEDEQIRSKGRNKKLTKPKDNDENCKAVKVDEKISKNEDEANFSNVSKDDEPIKKTYDKRLEDMEINSVEKYSRTFKGRRKFITEKEPTVSAIKEKYPFLFEKNMVFSEFEFITNKIGLLDIFKKNVGLYAEIIKSSVKSDLQRLVDSMLTDADEDKKKRVLLSSSLMLLPKYMADNRKGIIIVNFEHLPKDHDNRPHIKFEGSMEVCLQEGGIFRIYVEGIELCIAKNMVEAFFALLAAYYIFNAVYPECCKNTFYCLEKLYINHSVGPVHLKPKIKNLINSLEKSVKKKKKKM